jgi:hypothetical protein
MSFFSPSANTSPEMNGDDDEDPGMSSYAADDPALLTLSFTADVVQLMEDLDPDLGETRKRNPDALPPSNTFETAMYYLHEGLAALGRGNCVFAIKAGLLTGTLDLASSAAYDSVECKSYLVFHIESRTPHISPTVRNLVAEL